MSAIKAAVTAASKLKPAGADTTKPAEAETSTGRTRLHITPFSPSLLKAFVPPSLLPQASSISYHTVQTFPEKGFGYIELPTMEAQKLKKKLNGSILKGTKIRIEEARPEKRRAELDGANEEGWVEEGKERASKRPKKAKATDKVLPGFELPDNRHVKRGWTEPAGHAKEKKKSKEKKDKKHKTQVSQYSTEPELLFRTKLPPNVAIALPGMGKSKEKEKTRKSKSGRDVVVHEFARTTKHASFLKSSHVLKESKPVAEFVEGKGWVDEDGNVVEPEYESKRRRRATSSDTELEEIEVEKMADLQEQGSNMDNEGLIAEESGTGMPSHVDQLSPMDVAISAAANDSTSAPKHSITAGSTEKQLKEKDLEDSYDSSSVISTSSSDISSSSDESESEHTSESATVAASESQSNASSEPELESDSEPEASPSTFKSPRKPVQKVQPNPTVTVDPPSPSKHNGDHTIEQKEVHPLEALFKRPKLSATDTTPARLGPIDTSFSFFGNDEDVDEEEERFQVPHTPFTRHDMQFRGIRSAAPTPDTAAIGGRFKAPWADDEEEGEDKDGRDVEMRDVDATPSGKTKAGAAGKDDDEVEESEFAKWFWEHRGETNRAWKKRRREALKMKRQRENRRLGRRIV